MKLLLIPVVLAALGQAGDDPAKVMKAMEEKIARADALQVTFDGKIDSDKGKGTVKGTLAVAAGNKVRLAVDLEMEGKLVKVLVVSDGTKLVVSADGKVDKGKDTPKNIRPLMTALLARAGVTTSVLMSRKSDDSDKEDPLTIFQVSDFKALKREKVGDRTALPITYKLVIKDTPLTITATVWVDTETNLPLKRTLRGEKDGEKLTIAETYNNFRINPQLDPRTFELPR